MHCYIDLKGLVRVLVDQHHSYAAIAAFDCVSNQKRRSRLGLHKRVQWTSGK